MEGMGAAYKLGAHKSAFTVEYAGIHIFQGIPSQIIVAIAGGSRKVYIADAVILHSLDNLKLIVLGGLVYVLKTGI